MSGCLVCGAAAHTRGLCHRHAERWRRWGRPDPLAAWAAACREGRLCTCTVCGLGYDGYRGSQTCSPECDRERRRRDQLARWHAKTTAEKAAATARAVARRRAATAAKAGPLTCVVCEAGFVGLPGRLTCSPSCRTERARQISTAARNRQRAAAAIRTLTHALEARRDPD